MSDTLSFNSLCPPSNFVGTSKLVVKSPNSHLVSGYLVSVGPLGLSLSDDIGKALRLSAQTVNEAFPTWESEPAPR